MQALPSLPHDDGLVVFALHSALFGIFRGRGGTHSPHPFRMMTGVFFMDSRRMIVSWG